MIFEELKMVNRAVSAGRTAGTALFDALSRSGPCLENPDRAGFGFWKIEGKRNGFQEMERTSSIGMTKIENTS